jgi:hypothetical protein
MIIIKQERLASSCIFGANVLINLTGKINHVLICMDYNLNYWQLKVYELNMGKRY